MNVRCPSCGAGVPLLARLCAHCGATNPARSSVIGAAIALAVLIPAVAIAIYVATRWDRPLIEGSVPADQPAPPASPGTPASQSDFTWLQTAMKDCDAKAAQESRVLHFLIVPLDADPKLLADYRLLALNQIGNAAVLQADDTLKGLQRRQLTISSAEYAFSIRDEKTNAVRKWEPSRGVKWFSTTEGTDIAAFRMQFRPSGKGQDEAWGNLILHQRGNCYWVNAIASE